MHICFAFFAALLPFFFAVFLALLAGFDQLSWQGPVIADTLLQDDPTLDWAVRHGRYWINSFAIGPSPDFR